MIAAIAISLLLHLLLAGYIRWPFNQRSNEREIVRVRRITIARIVPHTPAPTPPPTPQPTTAAKPKVLPPAVTSTPRGSKGPPVAHVVAPAPSAASASPARATATPVPVATHVAQACLLHDISPAVAATADPPDIPADVRASKISGTSAIQVHVDPQGRVTSASLATSSGNAGLDRIALQAAKAATYSAALVKCKPVASVYTFTMKFVAW